MPPSVERPTLTYPGGAWRYQADRTDRHGVWIGLILTVILNYLPDWTRRRHSGTKLRHIVTAVKRTLRYEDWYSRPEFLQDTILKMLKKLSCFVALPLTTGLDVGEQLWQFDRTQNNAEPDKLSNERDRLARLTRKRWHWESMSGNPMSLRRVLKELCEEPRRPINLVGNTTAPPSTSLKADKSAPDAYLNKRDFGEHVRRSSAPAVAGHYSRRPLVAVDTNAPPALAVPDEPSAPDPPGGQSPDQSSTPFLTGSVSCREERRHLDFPDGDGGHQPEPSSSSTGLATSRINSRSSGPETVPHPATTPVLVPLFLPSPSPEPVVNKAVKGRKDDDEEYVLSDSSASDCSEGSESLDSDSELSGEEEPAADILLSLTRSGAEFGPPIMFGAANREQPPRDTTSPMEEEKAIRNPTASSSKRKLDQDIIERQAVPRQHKRRVTVAEATIGRSNAVRETGSPAASSSKPKPGKEQRSAYRKALARVTETAASTIVSSSARVTQSGAAFPTHHHAPADDDAVILDTLVNILSDSDHPKGVMEERLIWDAFRRVLPHIPRKAYHKVLSHKRLFFCEKQLSSAPDRSSELVPYYGYVPQHRGYPPDANQ